MGAQEARQAAAQEGGGSAHTAGWLGGGGTHVCIRQRREREHGVLGQCRCGGPDCSHSRKAEAKRLAPVSPERVCRQTKLGKEDLLALVRGHTD